MKTTRIAVSGGINFSNATALSGGVAGYFRRYRDIEVIPLHYSQEDALRCLLCDGSIDGFIGEIISETWVRTLPSRMHHTLINISGVSAIKGVSAVLPDDVAIGKHAAEHFIRRGYCCLYYAGINSYHSNRDRLDGFRTGAQKSGTNIIVFPSCSLSGPLYPWRDILYAMHKPAGVFCFDDYTARRLIAVCRKVGVNIPEEISIMGVGNSRIDSFFAGIGISSIEINYACIGWEAAAMLDEHLKSPPDAPKIRTVAPGGIVLRDTTGVGALNTITGRAINYIEKHLSEALSVQDVADILNVSRRLLELRFKEDIGRSPGREITRLRMEKAEQLLKNPRIKISDIAEKCGYSELSHFYAVFKRYHDGMPPVQWRHVM